MTHVRTRFRSSRSLPAALAAVALLAGPATALEDASWDQARVTALAAQLHAAIDGLYDAAKIEDRSFNQVKETDNYLVVEDLKSLKRYSGLLARKLEAGEDRDATQGLVDRIQVLVDRARVNKRSSPLLESAVEQRAAAAKIFNDFARYYGIRGAPNAPVASPPPSEPSE